MSTSFSASQSTKFEGLRSNFGGIKVPVDVIM